MKFTQETIKNYFSLPDQHRTQLLIGKNPYDFISRNSNKLIITIGDSWTWGADLTKQKTHESHIDKLEDDDYRLNHVYGGIISNALQTDFLNLGEPGSDNYYIANKLKELHAIIDQLDYDSVVTVCVFTEVARGFLGPDDNNVDYGSWLESNIHQDGDYYEFLKFINTNIADEIVPLLDKLQVYFATNFVDPIGFEKLESKFLAKTWLQTWCESIQQTYPESCYLVSPWVFEKLEKVFDLCPTLDRNSFLKWANGALLSADERATICKHDDKNFGQLLHPLSRGHQVWADYVLEKIAI